MSNRLNGENCGNPNIRKSCIVDVKNHHPSSSELLKVWITEILAKCPHKFPWLGPKMDAWEKGGLCNVQVGILDPRMKSIRFEIILTKSSHMDVTHTSTDTMGKHVSFFLEKLERALNRLGITYGKRNMLRSVKNFLTHVGTHVSFVLASFEMLDLSSVVLSAMIAWSVLVHLVPRKRTCCNNEMLNQHKTNAAMVYHKTWPTLHSYWQPYIIIVSYEDIISIHKKKTCIEHNIIFYIHLEVYTTM
ncbi:hypothetical protein WN51_00925 [Melipona quadrifasciata]|uniref:Uncharacterized protein n=1 Tax=Melipona quadrifasciata TaxID=166423 RepID=A0A0N0BET3_9HYME|nr:hypothetical protein WN51_00925 [Melipona quadrifasciata]